MFRARRRPLARAAMIGGTAYVAGRAGQKAAYRQEQEYQQESDQEARLAQLEAQSAQPAAVQPAAPQPAPTDMVGRLNQLSQLHASGALTDAEFAAAKQQLLAT
jgi:putative oligomerization/nucleic acid binding protein